MGDFGLSALVKAFIFLLIISPLAVWKFVDIVIYLCNHVHFGVK